MKIHRRAIIALAIGALALTGCSMPVEQTNSATATTVARTTTTRPPTTSPPVETSVSGTGQKVVDLKIDGGGFCVITSEVSGNSDPEYDFETNFAVELVDPGYDVWTNEIADSGSWKTSARFEEGNGYVTLEITAEGSWTISSACRG